VGGPGRRARHPGKRAVLVGRLRVVVEEDDAEAACVHAAPQHTHSVEHRLGVHLVRPNLQREVHARDQNLRYLEEVDLAHLALAVATRPLPLCAPLGQRRWTHPSSCP